MAGTDADGVSPSTTSSGFDTRPPEGFTGGGYSRGMYDPLPPGYGWAPPRAPLPSGWQVDPQTRQILPPGTQPTGQPPAGLLPGYSWIAPDTTLPEGWHIDPETDVLVPPGEVEGPATAGGAGIGWGAVGPSSGAADASATTGPDAPEAPWPQTGPQPGVDG